MRRIILFLAVCIAGVLSAGAQQVTSLTGAWDMAVGHYDSPADASFTDFVMLPVDADSPQPDVTTDEGADLWLRKRIYIPRDWKGERLTLLLERCYGGTTLYVNGQEAGTQTSAYVPHRYDVSKLLKAGQQNELVIRTRTDATGTFPLQGRMELWSQWHKLNIRQVTIVPNASMTLMAVNIELENHIPDVRLFPAYDYFIRASIRPVAEQADSMPQPLRVGQEMVWASSMSFVFPLQYDSLVQVLSGTTGTDADLLPWDEDHPNLYELTVEAGEDVQTIVFGLREGHIDADGQYISNGRQLHLRGVNVTADEARGLTTYAQWLALLRSCKNRGVNMLQLHQAVPPDAAFCAADRLGIYLVTELSDQLDEVLHEYGHHPSLLLTQHLTSDIQQ